MAMGCPLGPTFANIFMCSLEECMLDKCPPSSRPLLYSRYVDDTFLLFRHPHSPEFFLDVANSCHPNIRFTLEKEENNSLAFLDVLVTRDASGFNTTVFRKKTFTGLGCNFYSFCFSNFKLNSIFTLVHRALTHTSTWQYFHKEIEFLTEYLVNNCYPST